MHYVYLQEGLPGRGPPDCVHAAGLGEADPDAAIFDVTRQEIRGGTGFGLGRPYRKAIQEEVQGMIRLVHY